jgi:hypothetical protein
MRVVFYIYELISPPRYRFIITNPRGEEVLSFSLYVSGAPAATRAYQVIMIINSERAYLRSSRKPQSAIFGPGAASGFREGVILCKKALRVAFYPRVLPPFR